MPADIRQDPLTDRRAAITASPGKPLPVIPRDVRDPGEADCPFCPLAGQARRIGDELVERDGHVRVVRDISPVAVVLENPYSIFGADDPATDDQVGAGVSEVVIFREHHTCLEPVSDADVRGLAAVLERRRALLEKRFDVVEVLINVGANAGGSIAHLHGQVLAANVPGSPVCYEDRDGQCATCMDVALAGQALLVTTLRAGCTGYVPFAPSNNLELRVAGPCGTPVADAAPVMLEMAAGMLRALDTAGHVWPYNVLIHGGRHPHLHVLLRTDPGVVYPRAFNLVPVNADLAALARTIRTA